ncbi:hypothetical protein QE381_002572 [Microbacterium sp. SORGH_AS 888]|nr:hypothetical protein [Microbacterium sp. SORGH_AS_0888]
MSPINESSFDVSVARDGSGFGIDGLFDQNARIAATSMSLVPRDSPRVLAIDPRIDAFVDLTPGISAEQIEAGWQPVGAFSEAD